MKKICIYKSYFLYYHEEVNGLTDHSLYDIILIENEPTSELYTVVKGAEYTVKGILNENDMCELILTNETPIYIKDFKIY
jgi:hypothetical protein